MRHLLQNCSIVAIALSVAFTFTTFADDRSAEKILADINNVEYPKFDSSKREDQEYIKQYMEDMRGARKQEAQLILELYKADPAHEQLKELLPKRWGVLLENDETADIAMQEIAAIEEANPGSELAVEGQYIKSQAAMQKALWNEEPNVAAAAQATESFIKAAPKDERGARLLNMLASAYEDGSEEQMAVYRRIQSDYPETRAAKFATGKIKQATSVGKPFELTFNDAITGETVDMKDLRGKVVVLDFWATWCGPCIAEMPHMKELYSKHREAGVEFIGVSLDQPEDKGGLKALQNYVSEKEVPWPQYYQGNGWDSEFSTGWGINSIPALFVVDKKGNLRSVQARGKLEELIPQLLAE